MGLSILWIERPIFLDLCLGDSSQYIIKIYTSIYLIIL